MSHFLYEGEPRQPQKFSYGHGNRAVHYKTRGIQQQQEFDDDSVILQNFSNSNFDGTNSNSSTNTYNTNSRRMMSTACDGGGSVSTSKTATILVSKSKSKTGLPLLTK